MPFFEWLRANSEEHLLAASQRDMAGRYGLPAPSRGGSAFWRHLHPRLSAAPLATAPVDHGRHAGQPPPLDAASTTVGTRGHEPMGELDLGEESRWQRSLVSG